MVRVLDLLPEDVEALGFDEVSESEVSEESSSVELGTVVHADAPRDADAPPVARRAAVRQTTDPRELREAIAASRAEAARAAAVRRTTDADELAAAKAESAAYEASKEAEQRRRRFRAEDAAADRSRGLAALNARTLEAVAAALASDGGGRDCTRALERVLGDYARDARRLDDARRAADPYAASPGDDACLLYTSPSPRD